jgi:hypothetical protein
MMSRTVAPPSPKGNIAPFPLSNVSTNLLNKLGDLNIYISDEVLTYVINLPTVSRGTFEVIKINSCIKSFGK